MLPLDGEFGILYILYFILYSFIVYKIINCKGISKLFLTIVLIVSIIINTILYFKPENFEGGGSLVVLFYSGLILISTFLIVLINQLVSKIRK